MRQKMRNEAHAPTQEEFEAVKGDRDEQLRAMRTETLRLRALNCRDVESKVAAVVAQSEQRLAAAAREQGQAREQAESDLANMSFTVDMRRAAIQRLTDRLSTAEDRLRRRSSDVEEQLAVLHGAENARDALVHRALEVERAAGEVAEAAADAERGRRTRRAHDLDAAVMAQIAQMEAEPSYTSPFSQLEHLRLETLPRCRSAGGQGLTLFLFLSLP